ncbi:uncharacterized protein LTHEOB_151 [Lasiodiplodia theobromae]|uniref:uncharacterized protein n=1 Tax=Lasiodiplodia theobromae TaxID=45133 RepID=UPI0015C2DC58|nr:uncharacterized protein LTHEOB_151 [Lasiodiplodia theobromae]KAF4543452.1 hypothetical protein LTHEOB_151 [Lasiodiplodia theobromae]
MSSSYFNSFLPTYTYTPTLPTCLTPEVITFLTLLPLLTHTLRTLLTSTTTRLNRPWPRLFLTWSTLSALIIGETTRPPLSTSTASCTTQRTAVPASTALLVAATVPLFLLLLDEGVAWTARRQRRCAAVRHPLARWGEGVVTVAVGFDVLFVVMAAVVGVWFRPAVAAEEGQQQQQQRQAVVVGGHYPRGCCYEERKSCCYARRGGGEYGCSYLGWHERQMVLALMQGDLQKAAGCVIAVVMLVLGWHLAHKVYGVEPDPLDLPMLGERARRDGLRRRRQYGEVVDERPWDESVRIGVVQFALEFCFLVWSLVWVEGAAS